MSTYPRIAIPTPTSFEDDYNLRCWPQYAAAVHAAGGEAVRIPLGLEPSQTANLASSCSGVLLPGSPADVHPQKYGQATRPETAAADLPREATDELLLQDAFHLRKPLLGICFGLQIMNVWRGGTLVQHLETGRPHAPASDKLPIEHGLALCPDAHLLRSLIGSEITININSSHHQAIDNPGDGLLVAARAEGDQVIEALEATHILEQFVLGVQWHPERSYLENPASLAIFRAFIQAATRWHLPHA